MSVYCADLPLCCDAVVFFHFSKKLPVDWWEFRGSERCDFRWWYRTWSCCFYPLRSRCIFISMHWQMVRVQGKYDYLWLAIWKWSCKQAKWLKTELNSTFAAYIRWSIQWPCLLSISEKSNTDRSVLKQQYLFSVNFSLHNNPGRLIHETEGSTFPSQFVSRAMLWVFLSVIHQPPVWEL